MNKQPGFTLIEVLVTIIVTAFGLLGLAGIQTVSLKNNQTAFLRSQATWLAYDLADRMRSNVAAASTYVDVNNNATPDVDEVTMPTVVAQAGCSPASLPPLLPCQPRDLAENDLYEWHQSIAQILPEGDGVIFSSATAFTISITWDDNRDGTVDAKDPDFQMSFEL
ncbi:MAG: type IV pilus modification protein PilV [Methylococcaceae bacterium]